jgi:type IV pilus assembly protein PilA
MTESVNLSDFGRIPWMNLAANVRLVFLRRRLPLKTKRLLYYVRAAIEIHFGPWRATHSSTGIRWEASHKGVSSGDEASNMRKHKGFSLIELLIVVAIILIIAAIAIPSLLRSRESANESSAVASLRTINTGMISYNTAYPTVGFAANLLSLGGPVGSACTPSSSSACLIDAVLANNGNPSGSGKSGYTFTATGSGGTPNTTYYATGVPLTLNETGTRSFCSISDAVIRVQPTGAAIGALTTCQALNPLQ